LTYDLHVFAVNQELSASLGQEELAERIFKCLTISSLAHGKIENPIRLDALEHVMVDGELSNRLLEVIDDGEPAEALYLHGDLLLTLLGREETLGSKVDIKVSNTPAQAQRIVGDQPPVADERAAHVLMVVIAGWHDVVTVAAPPKSSKSEQLLRSAVLQHRPDRSLTVKSASTAEVALDALDRRIEHQPTERVLPTRLTQE
jgi:hypothetical protein